MSGRVVHFEIPVDDVERAQRFYHEAFGWVMNSMPQMQYTLVSTTETDDTGRPVTPGAINGGMLARQDAITNPIVTIEVDNMDEALTLLDKLGGKTVIGKQAVGDMGFSAYFTDPEGNLLGLWQSAARPAGSAGSGGATEAAG
jgi:predicted enzyme related to lactoylglutathione lyase